MTTSVEDGIGVFVVEGSAVPVARVVAVSVSTLVAVSVAVAVRVVVDVSATVAVGVVSIGVGVAGGIEPGATTLISTLPEQPGAEPGIAGA